MSVVRIRTFILLTTAAVAATTLLSTVACSSSPPAPIASDLPADVSIGVQQNRSDYGPRRIQVVVENRSSTTLEIASITLDAEQFVAPVADDGGTTITAGRTVNIPLSLPAANCASDDPTTSVTIDFLDPDRRVLTATVEPVDHFERLPQLRQEDCLRAAVDAVAVLTVARAPEVRTVAGATIASLEVAVAPTGAPGPLTIDSVFGTTLVAVADPTTGAIVTEAPVGLRLGGTDAPSSFTVTLVPNRCDPHAIGEDKRGSILPLQVSTADVGSGKIYVATSDEVRAALYAFVQAACDG